MDDRVEIERVTKIFNDIGLSVEQGDAEIFLGYCNRTGSNPDKAITALKRMMTNMQEDENRVL